MNTDKPTVGVNFKIPRSIHLWLRRQSVERRMAMRDVIVEKLAAQQEAEAAIPQETPETL